MAEPTRAVNPLFLRAESLQRGLDLLFLAAADMADSDGELRDRYALGAGEARLLQVVARWPELTVGQTRAALGISKQALNRTMRALKQRGLLTLRHGRRDRRERRLLLTQAGSSLAEELNRLQRQRLAQAYRRADATAVEGFATVLDQLITDPGRRELAAGLGEETP